MHDSVFTWVENKTIEMEEKGRSTLNDMFKGKLNRDGIWFVPLRTGVAEHSKSSKSYSKSRSSIQQKVDQNRRGVFLFFCFLCFVLHGNLSTGMASCYREVKVDKFG